MALVIKQWYASDKPDANGEYVRIQGREAGLISFLLSLLKVDPTTTLVVDARSVFYEQGSLAGFRRVMAPLKNVSSVSSGYSKPWKGALIIGGIMAALLTFLPIIGWLIGAGIGVLYYVLNKELFVGARDNGGQALDIVFKRSIIEGQNIDEQAGERIVSVIEMLLLGADQPRPVGRMREAPAAAAVLAEAKGELRDLTDRARNQTESIARKVAQAGERAATSLGSMAGGVAGSASSAAGKCPGCGVSITSSDLFCASCGHKLH